ncbi:MAG: hypothetical protein AAF282_22750 [Cyanobacteria bacterium P01_A01_bin.15]
MASKLISTQALEHRIADTLGVSSQLSILLSFTVNNTPTAQYRKSSAAQVTCVSIKSQLIDPRLNLNE